MRQDVCPVMIGVGIGVGKLEVFKAPRTLQGSEDRITWPARSGMAPSCRFCRSKKSPPPLRSLCPKFQRRNLLLYSQRDIYNTYSVMAGHLLPIPNAKLASRMLSLHGGPSELRINHSDQSSPAVINLAT
jgi:hypothetical protein